MMRIARKHRRSTSPAMVRQALGACSYLAAHELLCFFLTIRRFIATTFRPEFVQAADQCVPSALPASFLLLRLLLWLLQLESNAAD